MTPNIALNRIPELDAAITRSNFTSFWAVMCCTARGKGSVRRWVALSGLPGLLNAAQRTASRLLLARRLRVLWGWCWLVHDTFQRLALGVHANVAVAL